MLFLLLEILNEVKHAASCPFYSKIEGHKNKWAMIVHDSAFILKFQGHGVKCSIQIFKVAKINDP